MVERKIRGEKPVKPKFAKPSGSNVVNLMDALRRSVNAEGGKESEPRRKSAAPARRKTSRTAHRMTL